jgi:hypothetical protein
MFWSFSDLIDTICCLPVLLFFAPEHQSTLGRMKQPLEPLGLVRLCFLNISMSSLESCQPGRKIGLMCELVGIRCAQTSWMTTSSSSLCIGDGSSCTSSSAGSWDMIGTIGTLMRNSQNLTERLID